MSTHWYTYPSADLAAEACSRQILLHLEQALAGRSTASLAVSGGSTPRLMFEHLARKPFDWRGVHLFWADERMVPPTSPESNYLLVEDHFIKPARFPQRNVHRVHGELRPDIAAEHYAAEIEEFFGLGENELPHFDVIHLGMGADGHTASLFPGDPLIEDRKGIAAAVHIEKGDQWRVTLLPGALLNAKHILMLVAGAGKAEALKAVMEGPYDPVRYPAQAIAHHSRHLTWCVDSEAAALVTG